MKTIVLMRHAKAEPGVPGQRDFDRPLAPRGRSDAQAMGKVLSKLGVMPAAVVASPAARAKETAEIAAKAAGSVTPIRWDPSLYDAPGESWLAAMAKLPAAVESVLIVAHSPGIAEAAALLAGASARGFDVPTAGMLAFDDPSLRWRDIGDGAAALRWFLRPKLVGLL
jgi:phosphohistidine phosphatase